MDRELLYRIYKARGKFLYISKPLACYREGGVNQINYKECARENMEISIKYGISSVEAKVRRIYFKLHDTVWKIIQKLDLESVFHRKI